MYTLVYKYYMLKWIPGNGLSLTKKEKKCYTYKYVERKRKKTEKIRFTFSHLDTQTHKPTRIHTKLTLLHVICSCGSFLLLLFLLLFMRAAIWLLLPNGHSDACSYVFLFMVRCGTDGEYNLHFRFVSPLCAKNRKHEVRTVTGLIFSHLSLTNSWIIIHLFGLALPATTLLIFSGTY